MSVEMSPECAARMMAALRRIPEVKEEWER